MKVNKKLLILMLVIGTLIASSFIAFALSDSDEDTGIGAGLEIEFIPLGDHGDCFVARFGDIQLLVDAGTVYFAEGQSKMDVITSVIDKYMEGDEEKVWEYIIVTHSDEDHIGSFSNNLIEELDTGVFKHFKKNGWTIDTLIDFDITQDDTIKGEEYDKLLNGKAQYFYSDKTGTFIAKYNQYRTRRDDYVKEGVIKNYYTASQCCAEQRGVVSEKPDAKSTFDFGDATIRILYNYYYDHRIYPTRSKNNSTERNCLSVCFMIEYGEHKMLFTGDLEEYDSTKNYSEVGGSGNGAETLLYEYNKEYLEGGVDVYKASHHGSMTSNSTKFIDNIRPNYVVITAVAGSEHHESEGYGSFPVQSALDNFLKYTDYIYVTQYAIADEKTGKVKRPKDYYGNIVISSDGNDITVQTELENDENNNPLPITDTKWFKQNRTSSLSTYIFDLNGEYGLGHCTLVKYGHIDILIDCGVNGKTEGITNSEFFLDDIKKYCVDGVLEYVIVTCAQTDSLSQMINGRIFDNFKIENLVDYGKGTNVSAPTSTGWVGKYVKERDAGIKNGSIVNYYPRGSVSGFYVNSRIDINLYYVPTPDSKNENNYSISTIIKFCGKKLLFMGDVSSKSAEPIVAMYKRDFANVDFYLVSNFGNEDSNSKSFLEIIQPKVSVISATAGINMNTHNLPSQDVCKQLLGYAKKDNDTNIKQVFIQAQLVNNKIQTVCGDIRFEMVESNGEVASNGMRVTYSGTDLTYRGLESTIWYKKAS